MNYNLADFTIGVTGLRTALIAASDTSPRHRLTEFLVRLPPLRALSKLNWSSRMSEEDAKVFIIVGAITNAA
jgi:hypothetical protein